MNRTEARKKAEKLVAQMTPEEKAGQLRYDAPAIKRLGIPAYNWWNESLHGVARAGQATVFPQAIGLGATFDPELLGEISEATGVEGRAKYNAYSAHGDRDIYKGLTFWAPNVNIFRDPRWGRGHETYGEDPYLTSRLGVAYVKGLQGEGRTMRAAACAKHFAVHSGPEALRHEFNAEATPKDLRETYLPAFEALVKEAKVEAVMGAYNRTNGEPCCASPALQSILRGEWGFEGHFVSDCWAIRDFHTHHMVTDDAMHSAALALNNGCDLNCGNTYLHVLNAFRNGLISEETITESAVRLFTTRYLLGLFDGSEYDSVGYAEIESEEHLALAERAAQESFVLLKNNGILPLKKDKLKTVAVIGPNADSRAALAGNYHGTASRYVTAQEGIQDYLKETGVRVLTSVGCALFKERAEGLSLPGDRLAEAAAAAEHSDAVILCLGLDETLEGEEGDTGNSYASGDKTDLQLPATQRKLMEVIAATGKPVILCMMAGSDLDLSYASAHFDAVLQTWYPGCQGGAALARVLFGEVSPSGKLPVTFYESLEELPEFTDYSMKGRTYRYMEHPAQYPFGYGLTYSDVYVTGAKLRTADIPENLQAGRTGQMQPASGKEDRVTDEYTESRTVPAQPSDGAACAVENRVPEEQEAPDYILSAAVADAGLILTAEVRNGGAVDTDEVVQVYIRDTDSGFAPLHPSLCAFRRIHLRAGETAVVPIPVSAAAFTTVDESGARRRYGSCFELYAGCSQPDLRSVELTGHRTEKLLLRIR